MFDIGFGEIFLIAIVGLLVLGPERLPKAARFTGLWVRRARAQWYSVKAELENELADEDLRRSLQQARADLAEARDSLAQGGASLQRQLEEARTGVQDSLQERDRESDADLEPPLSSVSDDALEPLEMDLIEAEQSDAARTGAEQPEVGRPDLKPSDVEPSDTSPSAPPRPGMGRSGQPPDDGTLEDGAGARDETPSPENPAEPARHARH